jgi:multidrug resistance efflux pump
VRLVAFGEDASLNAVVYERSMLTDTTELDLLGSSLRAGETTRLAQHIPVKMMHATRRGWI